MKLYKTVGYNDHTYLKVSFVYSKEPLWLKIFRQKSAQIKGQNMHEIFLGALHYEIVSSLCGV